MNKKLIALAVAGLCAAPAAMAQTANPVTLYGSLRMDIENVEAKGTNGASRRTRITDHPSVLGVRGTEDLGGGLKAFFQLETAFAADQEPTTAGQTNGFANRNSGVGLQGGFGSVMIGRWDMPFKVAMGTVDPFGDINKGDWTSATADQGNFSRRVSNLVQYWSPNIGGLAIRLAYQVDEGRTATAKPTQTGASISYSKGPLYLAYAYEEHKDGATSQGLAGTPGAKEEGNGVAARFAIGPVKLSGHYGQYKVKGRGDKEKSYLLGVDWAIGRSQILGSYQNAELGSADCDVYNVGWQYNFSKRTNMLLSFVKIDNSTGMNCNFGAGGGLGGAGSDPQGFGLGLRHYF